MTLPRTPDYDDSPEASRPVRRPEADETAGSGPEPGLTPDQETLLTLQQTLGNRAVGRILRRARQAPPGGQPLPAGLRDELEGEVNHDLGDVRVHADAQAAAQAESLSARAYTVGDDIVFGAGEYDPASEAGRRLLLHEVAHVVQADHAGAEIAGPQLNPAGHASEQQAEAASQGQPTALDAAPAGIARAPKDEAGVAEPAAAAPAAPAPAAAAEPALTDEEAERQRAIRESIDTAETRARTFINTDYNDVQDAARDFAVSAQRDIDQLPGAPSGYTGLASTVVGFAASAFSTRYYKSFGITMGSTVASGLFSTGQAYLTMLLTEKRDDAKAAAKAAMYAAARAISSTQATAFDKMRDGLYPALVKLAKEDEEVAALLETGSINAINTVITEHLGVPDPDQAPLYGPVREAMEVALADWVTMQERQAQYRHIGTEFGLPSHLAEPGRAEARARVAEAVRARSGEPEPPSFGEQFNAGINTAMLGLATFAATGQIPGLVPPGEGAAAESVPVQELEPLDDAAEAGEQRRERAIARSVTQADTRAREFLNTHYNDVQDALRDFVIEAEAEIDELPGAPSGHWGMIPTLFGAAMTVLGLRFPPEAIGKLIAASAASAAASGIGTVATTAVGDDRDAAKQNARDAMQALASGMANKQAGIFGQARRAVGSELLRLATSDEEARVLFESGDRDSLNALITDGLGIPDPDAMQLYADVRKSVEVPFKSWLQRQKWLAAGLGWLAQFDPDEEPTKRRIAAEAEMRLGEPETEAEPPAVEAFIEMEEEVVTPVEAQPDEQLARDRLILKRVIEADNRARGFLNTYHDELQDAIRDFVNSANTRIDSLGSKVADYVNLANNLLGLATGVLAILFPPSAVAGAIISAAGSVIAQGLSGYSADKTASDKLNARRAMRSLARSIDLAYVAGFRQGRAALGPVLLLLSLTDEDVRAALEAGGQDQIDTVIEQDVGIAKPDKNKIYEQVRLQLEMEFIKWFARQQGLSQEETKELMDTTLAAVSEDAAQRSDDKRQTKAEGKKDQQ